MKKLILIIIFNIFIFNELYSQIWEYINGPGLVRNITSLEVDNGTIYIGVYEKFYKSSDFGTTWTEMKYNDSLSFLWIHKIVKIDTTIFLQSNYRTIFPYYEFLKSTNDGINWTEEKCGYELTLVEFVTKIGNEIYSQILVKEGNEVKRKLLKYDNINNIWDNVIETLSENIIMRRSKTIGKYGNKILIGCSIIKPSVDNGVKNIPNIYIYDLKNQSIQSIVDSTSDLWKSYVNCFLVIGNDIFSGTSTGIYKSTDEGITWIKKSNGLHFKNQYYDYDYEIHKMFKYEGNIYAITNPPSEYGDYKSSYSTLVYSTDNGENWINSKLFAYDPFIIDMPQYFGVINNKLLISTLDGLYEVDKDLTKKVQLINDTLSSGMVKDFFVDNDKMIYATKSNDFIYQINLKDNIKWEKLAKSQSLYNVNQFSKMNNNIYCLIGTQGYVTSNTFVVSNDTGKTFRFINNIDSTMNITYYGLYLHTEDSVYVTTDKGVFLSNDEGVTWQRITSDDFMYKVKTMLKIDDYIYVGTYDDGLLRSINGGKTWEKLKLPTRYTTITINDILLHNNNLYIATKQYYNSSRKIFVNGEGIFMSSDYGDSWEKMNNGYPDSLETASLASYGDYLFAATSEYGSVYYSSDEGEIWHSLNKGLAGFTLSRIQVFGDYLYAGTSVGLHKYNLKNLITSVDEIEKRNYLYSTMPYPMPAKNRVQAEIYWDTNLDINKAEIKIYNIYGEEIKSENSIEVIPESNWYGKLIWNCEGIEPGVYIIIINYGTEKKAIKAIKN